MKKQNLKQYYIQTLDFEKADELDYQKFIFTDSINTNCLICCETITDKYLKCSHEHIIHYKCNLQYAKSKDINQNEHEINETNENNEDDEDEHQNYVNLNCLFCFNEYKKITIND